MMTKRECSCGVTIALRNKLADARGHSYHVVQVLHQSMQTQLSYWHVGQTDGRTDGFSALYSRRLTLGNSMCDV